MRIERGGDARFHYLNINLAYNNFDFSFHYNTAFYSEFFMRHSPKVHIPFTEFLTNAHIYPYYMGRGIIINDSYFTLRKSLSNWK